MSSNRARHYLNPRLARELYSSRTSSTNQMMCTGGNCRSCCYDFDFNNKRTLALMMELSSRLASS